MLSPPPFRPAISLSVNSRLKPLQSTHVQNVFGNEDSDEEKPQTSAEKFHSKYGNLKARDERAVKKVLEENPDIYDYDAAYGSIQEKRSRIEQEEETKKLDRTVRICLISMLSLISGQVHRQVHAGKEKA